MDKEPNVTVLLHRKHIPVLLASVRTVKESAPGGAGGFLADTFREIEFRLEQTMREGISSTDDFTARAQAEAYERYGATDWLSHSAFKAGAQWRHEYERAEIERLRAIISKVKTVVEAACDKQQRDYDERGLGRAGDDKMVRAIDLFEALSAGPEGESTKA